MYISFFVAGVPVPKGSAKAFVVKGRAIVTQTNGDRQKPWASAIGYTAMQKMEFQKPVSGPMEIGMTFYMPRPKSHYRTGKMSHILREGAPHYHIGKPDLDKLERCVFDALTGVVWNDDSQVCHISNCVKVYQPVSMGCGVEISIRSL